jgi:hypothetical protein
MSRAITIAPQETPTPTPAFAPLDNPDELAELVDVDAAELSPITFAVLIVPVSVASVGVDVLKSVDIHSIDTA